MTATIATIGVAAMTATIATIGVAVMIATIGAIARTAKIAEAEPWMRKCSKCCRSKRLSARSRSSLASSLPLSLS